MPVQSSKSSKEEKKMGTGLAWLSKHIETIIVSVITAFLTYHIALLGKYDDLDNSIYKIGLELQRLSGVEERQDDKIDEIIQEVNGIDDLSEKYKDLEYSVQQLYQAVNPVTISASGIVVEEMKMIEGEENHYSVHEFKIDTLIGKDDLGNEYTAGDIIGEAVILSYEEDGKDIFFYGCLDDRLNWNGYCVFNIYQKGTLINISESVFLNGTRTKYKSLVKDGSEIWIYNDRTCEVDMNSGTTSKLKMHFEKTKDFECEKMKYNDILYIDNVLKILAPQKLHFYSGCTKDGMYCDDTGEAYFISYFDDGSVKTLYQGCFKNGEFNDASGNAWYITKEKNTDYMFYKGAFVNNEVADAITEQNFKNNLTLLQIEELISSNETKHIEVKLIFDVDSST